MQPVKTVYFDCPIKSSESEHSIVFNWPIFFCEFDFVRLCSAIELSCLIKSVCVRLLNVLLDMLGLNDMIMFIYRSRTAVG